MNFSTLWLKSCKTKKRIINALIKTFGKHIAKELLALPEEMLKYWKKIINNAIFEAQIGTLNRTSQIVTDAVYPPRQTFLHFIEIEPSPGGSSTAHHFLSFQ
jgi:hypothetical protein